MNLIFLTEHSVFKVIIPDGIHIRYLNQNIKIKPDIESDSKRTVYTWKVSDVPAKVKEPFGMPISSSLPIVYISPDKFEIENYPGRTDSWKDFGLWMNALLQGRNDLNTETTNHIKELVANVPDTINKIRVLYKFMQNKTRYVSIQIGIGRWQPLSAATVDKLSYGDCKALTNYMKSLLDIVGIKSYFTLIRAGEDAPYMIRDFPSNQFNHAILFVPLRQDTIWLECTNQYIPFGFTGSFTDDRDALAITDSGGVIVHTKTYSLMESTQQSNCMINLDENLNANINLKTRYSGIFYDKINRILHIDNKDKKNMILKNLEIPGANLISYKHEENRSENPYIDQDINLNIAGMGMVVRDRIILLLNVIDKETDIPINKKERTTDIFIRRSFVKTDTIVFNVPDTFEIEKVPASRSIENSEFGHYSTYITADKHEVIMVRTFSLNKGIYPADHYKDFVRFYEEVNKLDNQKFILKKKL